MVFGKTLLDEIDKEAKRQQEAQREKLRASTYWAMCPSCGKKVAKRQILAEGCWACGWKGTEEELERARAKEAIGRQSLPAAESYRIRCPKCGRLVITEELREKGCYICGWIPLTSPLKGEE